MALRMEHFVSLGILVIIIGFAIVFFGMLKGAKDADGKAKVAIGGFIGPIPFGFGNDKNLVFAVAIISVAVLLLWITFSLRIRN